MSSTQENMKIETETISRQEILTKIATKYYIFEDTIKSIDITDFNELEADRLYKRGYELSQQDDWEQAEEDPNYEYCSCLDEAICIVGCFTYDWEEVVFKSGYISGC